MNKKEKLIKKILDVSTEIVITKGIIEHSNTKLTRLEEHWLALIRDYKDLVEKEANEK